MKIDWRENGEPGFFPKNDNKVGISKNQLGFVDYPTDDEIAWEINNLRENVENP